MEIPSFKEIAKRKDETKAIISKKIKVILLKEYEGEVIIESLLFMIKSP